MPGIIEGVLGDVLQHLDTEIEWVRLQIVSACFANVVEHTPIIRLKKPKFPLVHHALQSQNKIKSLDLCGTQITDATPLAHCTAPQTLDLYNTQVLDVSPLAHCVSLQTLDLTNTHVLDVTPLAHCVSLQTLYLSFTQISDVTALRQQNLNIMR